MGPHQDAVDGLLLAAGRGADGEIYIIAGERWLTMQLFVETASRALGVDAPTRHIPIPVARIVATVVELAGGMFGRTPALRREMVDAFLVNRAFDISKARRELGYRPKVGLGRDRPVVRAERVSVRWDYLTSDRLPMHRAGGGGDTVERVCGRSYDAVVVDVRSWRIWSRG